MEEGSGQPPSDRSGICYARTAGQAAASRRPLWQHVVQKIGDVNELGPSVPRSLVYRLSSRATDKQDLAPPAKRNVDDRYGIWPKQMRRGSYCAASREQGALQLERASQISCGVGDVKSDVATSRRLPLISWHAYLSVACVGMIGEWRQTTPSPAVLGRGGRPSEDGNSFSLHQVLSQPYSA